MTMLSFRVADDEAAEIQQWSEALGIDRSEFMREAIHRELVRLRGALEAERWEQLPATDVDSSLAEIADWGPAEDWSDWRDAPR